MPVCYIGLVTVLPVPFLGRLCIRGLYYEALLRHNLPFEKGITVSFNLVS